MQPQYQKLKQFICEQIDQGIWAEGHQVDSENMLADRFSVSRMTANRALKELADDGVLVRVAGVGTFVAEQIPQAPLVEIKNIADEIRARGHDYQAHLHCLEAVTACDDIAMALAINAGQDVYHSVVVHCENGIPVQLEDRHINPALAPEYLSQDFNTKTPHEYLSKTAPLTEAEHIIEAILPDQKTCTLLELQTAEPCLLLRRRTWSGNSIASAARLIHPSSRYHLGGRFSAGRSVANQADQTKRLKQKA